MRASLNVLLVVVVLVASVLVAAPAKAQQAVERTPGTAPPTSGFSANLVAAPAPVAPVVVESGRISLSVDAVGTALQSGSLDVLKPAGGTVRGAYLAAASTGFSEYTPVDGDISVLGVPVDFDEARTMRNGISSVNVWADITGIVKPTLDASAPGSISIVVSEGARAADIDGVIIAVIFDDPTATADRSVILAYGAQQVTGDTIRLARLPETPLQDVTASLGVGISFGFQPTDQDSALNVNGTRVSTSAGGQDDGGSVDGALITVGGLGDSISNPENPFARGSDPGCPGCDDELYDLTPFITADSVTELTLTTTNDSADDNFMFAALDVSGAAATWKSAADPCADIDLILCYAPEVRFHPNEEYFPWDPDLFTLGSELIFSQDGACLNDTVLTTELTPVDIALERYFASTFSVGRPSSDIDFGWKWPPVDVDIDVCYSDDELYGLQQFTRPFDANSASEAPESNRPSGIGLRNGFFMNFTEGATLLQGYRPQANDVVAPIYAQILPDDRGSNRRVISYLMFYAFDPKAEASLGVDINEIVSVVDGVIAHQGDWERLDVVLGSNDVPEEVRWYGHGCDGPTFDASHIKTWTELQAGLPNGGGLVDGSHPIVYSAQGSHASYPTQHQAGPKVCPEADGGALKGTTDNAAFVEGSSGVWQPWLDAGSIVDPRDECWFGFGGAWGSTGGGLQTALSRVASVTKFDAVKDATGPAGPYHNMGSGRPASAIPAKCSSGVLLTFSGDVEKEWGEAGTVSVSQAQPGAEYILTIASIEKLVGRATADAAGSLVFNFVIPEGTPPGLHHVVVRDAATGKRVGAKMISVTIPQACLVAAGNVADGDGDAVLDSCDNDPLDGPLADYDGDAVANYRDNCPQVSNTAQATILDRSIGAACDPREGFNLVPIILEAAAVVAAPVDEGDPDPAPAPAPAVSPVAVTRPANPGFGIVVIEELPPEQQGVLGFGTAPNPQLPQGALQRPVSPVELPVAVQAPVAVEVPVTSPSDQPTGVIAHTGGESQRLASAGTFLIGMGLLALACGRMQRRRTE